MKKLMFMLLLALLGAGACSEPEKPPQKEGPGKEIPSPLDDPDEPYTSVREVDISHYVMGFILPKNFKANGYLQESSPSIDLWIHDSDWTDYGASDIDKQAQYEALCVHYGDISYNNVRTLDLFPDQVYYCFLGVDIVSIDVISAQAWGERAAGSSLADLCTLVSTTPREYIASGYTQVYDWSQWPPYFTEYMCATFGEMFPERKPVVKLLSECAASDLSLISLMDGRLIGSIYFAETPPQPVVDSLTVIITLANGEVHKVPVK